jgi:hypothetical protein
MDGSNGGLARTIEDYKQGYNSTTSFSLIDSSVLSHKKRGEIENLLGEINENNAQDVKKWKEKITLGIIVCM